MKKFGKEVIIAMTIGQKIEELRIAKSLKIKDLAKSIGVSTVTLHAWIVGKHKPHAYLVVKIAKALECDYDELIKLL